MQLDDLEKVRARFDLARLAGIDATESGNGWDTPQIDAVVRSWQDVGRLHDEVKRLKEMAPGAGLMDAVQEAHRIKPEPGDVVLLQLTEDFDEDEIAMLARIWQVNVPEVRPVFMRGVKLVGLLDGEALSATPPEPPDDDQPSNVTKFPGVS